MIWAKGAVNNNAQVGFCVAIDTSDNIFVTGAFNGPSITFDSITLTGSSDMFIVKYDALGNILWGKNAGGSSRGVSIVIDLDGDAYVTGSFYSPSITFGTTTITSAGYDDIFVVKYSKLGNVLWAIGGGGANNNDISKSLAVDGNRNVYITGSFVSFTNFGSYALTGAGGFDMFVAKLCQVTAPTVTASGATTFCQGASVTLTSSAANSYLWSNGATTQSTTISTNGNYNLTVTIAGGCTSNSVTTNVTVTPTNNIPLTAIICAGDSIFLQGNYQTTTGTYYDTLSSVSGCDSVIATTLTINSIFNTTTTSICSGDSIFLQGIYQTIAGTYYDTLPSISGCDSIIATTLTINSIFNTFLTTSICSGDSILLQGSYQTTVGTYYDSLKSISGCDSIISSTLTVITTDTCNVGIKEPYQLRANLYPNPNSGKFTLIFTDIQGNEIQIKVIDVLGKIVYFEKARSMQNSPLKEIDIGKLNTGIYMLQVKADEKQLYKKIIIE